MKARSQPPRAGLAGRYRRWRSGAEKGRRAPGQRASQCLRQGALRTWAHDGSRNPVRPPSSRPASPARAGGAGGTTGRRRGFSPTTWCASRRARRCWRRAPPRCCACAWRACDRGGTARPCPGAAGARYRRPRETAIFCLTMARPSISRRPSASPRRLLPGCPAAPVWCSGLERQGERSLRRALSLRFGDKEIAFRDGVAIYAPTRERDLLFASRRGHWRRLARRPPNRALRGASGVRQPRGRRPDPLTSAEPRFGILISPLPGVPSC
jgi:hypothetical protein